MMAELNYTINIDFNLLRQQKEDLLEMRETAKGRQIDSIDGILGLFDYLQDVAANELGEENIFQETDDE